MCGEACGGRERRMDGEGGELRPEGGTYVAVKEMDLSVDLYDLTDEHLQGMGGEEGGKHRRTGAGRQNGHCNGHAHDHHDLEGGGGGREHAHHAHDSHHGHDHSHDDDDGGCTHHHHHGNLGVLQYVLPHSHGLRNHRTSGVVRLLVAESLYLFLIAGLLLASWVSNSHALAVEALHSTLDSIAVFLALVASFTATRAPTRTASFGYERAEMIAALFSVVTLLGFAGMILYSTVQNLVTPAKAVTGSVVMYTSLASMAVNLGIITVLQPSSGPNASVRAAWNHAVMDCMENFTVFLASLFMIYFPDEVWIDPVLSCIIVLIVVVMNAPLLLNVLRVLMQMTPRHFRVDLAYTDLRTVDGVVDVRDLHAWTLSTSADIVSVRLLVDKQADRDVVLSEATEVLRSCGRRVAETCVQIEAVDSALLLHGDAAMREAFGEHGGGLPGADHHKPKSGHPDDDGGGEGHGHHHRPPPHGRDVPASRPQQHLLTRNDSPSVVRPLTESSD